MIGTGRDCVAGAVGHASAPAATAPAAPVAAPRPVGVVQPRRPAAAERLLAGALAFGLGTAMGATFVLVETVTGRG